MRPAAELEGGFSRRAIGWLVTASLLSLAFGGLFSAFGQGLAERPDSGANSFSYSAVGHRALAELLRGNGLEVTSRRDPTGSAPGPHRPLILAEPLVRDKQSVERVRRLRDEAARRQAPLLLVLPKWKTLQDRENSKWIAAAVPLPVGDVERVVGGVKIVRPGTIRECRARLGGSERRYRIDLQRAQLIALAAGSVPLVPVVTCGESLLVARLQGAPPVYLLADPDLVENHGLATADRAEIIHALLVRELAAEEVIFDETIHGLAREPGLFAEALRFPLVFAFLQSLVLAGVVLWAGTERFGKPLPAREAWAEGPEALIDNLARLHADAEGPDGRRGNP